MKAAIAGAATSGRSAIIVMGALWGAALVVPAAHFVAFDGLPFSSGAELAFLVTALVALGHAHARERIRDVITTQRLRRAVIVLGMLVVGAKLVLYFAAPHGGFAACYTNPVAPRPDGSCERSYENLWNQDGVTRFDDRIDFGPRDPADGDRTKLTGSNWNLSFVNDTRLNVYPEPGNLDVERLPFAVRWHATVDLDAGRFVPVRYVGEGTVRIGEKRHRLPPTYRDTRTAFIRVEGGRQRIVIAYRFDDEDRIGGRPARGPYATITVGEPQISGAARQDSLLRAAGPSAGWRALGIFVDLALALVALGLAAALAHALAPMRRPIAVAVVVGGLAWALARSRWGLGPVSLPVAPTVLAFVALYVVITWRRTHLLLLLGAPAAVALAVERVLTRVPDLHVVLFRQRGSDWQTYQSFARAILESGSLEGGEKVFYYQPGFRYWAFGSHALLGDGDALPEILGLGLLLVAVLAATRWSIGRGPGTVPLATRSRLLVVGAGAALILAVTSTPLVDLVEVGASEHPTWILVPLVLPLLFTRVTWPRVLSGAAILGATAVFRPNQAVPSILLMAVFLVWTVTRDRRRTIGASVLFVVVLLLPALHNVWYGDRIELLPTGASTVHDLPLDRLPDVFSDSSVRTLLRDKVGALTYLSPKLPRDDVLGAAILAIQVLWITCVVRAFRRRTRVPWLTWCVLAWPLSFALPFVSYDVFIYFPRHIVAMYVAAAVAVIFVEARYSARGDVASQTRRKPSSKVTAGS